MSALRLYIAADVNDLAGNPFFDTQSTLIDSVTITQFDEPVERYIESFPYVHRPTLVVHYFVPLFPDPVGISCFRFTCVI